MVDKAYATGKVLYDIGVISGVDMTPEAALTKLSFVLGKDELDLDKKRKMMQKNLRGEMSGEILGPTPSLKELPVLPKIARVLRISSSKEVEILKDSLFPSLTCSAAKRGDLGFLEQIRESGGNLGGGCCEKRTALHLAARAGNLEVVQYLLEHGVSIHSKDDNNQTPLDSAVRGRNIPVIKLLSEAGGQMGMGLRASGSALCLLASEGDLEGLAAWHAAGINLQAVNPDGRTALHMAAKKGYLEMVKFLIENGGNPTQPDDNNVTAVQEATMNGHEEILGILNGAYSFRGAI